MSFSVKRFSPVCLICSFDDTKIGGQLPLKVNLSVFDLENRVFGGKISDWHFLGPFLQDTNR
jgi:hypothetical protein